MCRPGRSCAGAPGAGSSSRAGTTWRRECIDAGEDERDENTVTDDLLALLENTVELRFRSDVPVGLCVSGGLDSSLLLGLVARTHPDAGSVNAFTFYCDHPDYDERRWIEPLLARTPRPWHASLLQRVRCPGADDGGAAPSGRAVGRLPDARDGDRARARRATTA